MDGTSLTVVRSTISELAALLALGRISPEILHREDARKKEGKKERRKERKKERENERASEWKGNNRVSMSRPNANTTTVLTPQQR